MNCSTECFTDLGKLNLTMVVHFKLEPIFDTSPAASKMKLTSKWSKLTQNNRLANNYLNP
jgi:hypothetical protein